jgi:hypothetical protein
VISQYLYGPEKPDSRSALVLNGEFAAGVPLSIHVQQVSQRARLQVLADGEQVFEHYFEPRAGDGEWKKSEYKPEWKIYQAVYDRVYTTALPKRCQKLELRLAEGDWLTFSELKLGALSVVPNNADWGTRQQELIVSARGDIATNGGDGGALNRERLYAETVQPWAEFSREHGIGVHVGEWGAHHFTPHAVALAWMRDCLANWRSAGLGQALWNLRGSFGCVDSGRGDVAYEDYRGHRLDRQMLEILKTSGSAA